MPVDGMGPLPSRHVTLLVHMNDPDKRVVEVDKLLQFAFNNGASQDSNSNGGKLLFFLK